MLDFFCLRTCPVVHRWTISLFLLLLVGAGVAAARAGEPQAMNHSDAAALAAVPTTTAAAAPATTATAADVLVLHHSLPSLASPGMVDGENILDLLGHFGVKGQLKGMDEYHKGDLAHYRFAIILGDDERTTPFPPAVIEDIRTTTLPVMWIRRHIHELLADPKFATKVGFNLGPELLRGYTAVQYRGKTLTKNEPFLFPVVVKTPAKVQVLATATNAAGDVRPYAVRSGNFWYFADSPFAFATEGDRYWVFADLLHDFFGVEHPQKREALLRIEDVSVELNPQTLIDVADLLHSRDIPFQISLIPIFKRPEDAHEITLSERPEFVHAIQYMVKMGGTVIMHGTTHQFRGKSGDDYEFWDGLNGRPIPGDSRALVEKKLYRGVEECMRNGIYPVAWETPHYMASHLDYAAIAKHFTCAYESVPSVDREDSAHQFPYTSIDRFGRLIIPESLGYIDLEKPDVDGLLQNADRLQVVRDGVASFFFHPFLDLGLLAKIVDGIESMGYEFTTVRDFSCRVKFDDRVIQTVEAPIELDLEDRYLHRFFIDKTGEVTSEAYSEKPITGKVQDAGVVPEGSMLVMEGVFTSHAREKTKEPSWRERFSSWWQARKPPVVTTDVRTVTQPKAIVVWEESLSRNEWNDQSSFVAALATFGFSVAKQSLKDFPVGAFEAGTILVVPNGAAGRFNAKQISSVETFVRAGGRLVLDGPSRLAATLGIKQEGKRPHAVHALTDVLIGSEPILWNPSVEMVRYSTPKTLATYAIDRDSEIPMASAVAVGDGRVLYLAATFDPTTSLGYSRYPYFVHYLLQGFDIKLPLGRSELELYFDPGQSNRQGMDIGRLAGEWRKLGVRAIYAAAWQFWPSWSYDYAHLIEACHKNGILVYAWFELPHVSRKFWDDHSDCHAKTATGEDGVVGWRSHIDLDLPACQDAAFDFVTELLRAYPWDGVNIAELNFDTDGGPERPNKYLPMGVSTRQAFKALGGFDPIALFDAKSPYYWRGNPKALRKFEDYRNDRVEAWHRALLRRVVPLAKERDLEIIVTMLDSLHSTTVSRDTGVDSHSIVALMDEFPFTLQVEDPENQWAESPTRYTRFAETYLRLVKDRRRLMFDLNVVPSRDISHSHAPTQRLSGIELAHSLVFAGTASGRVGIYSEGTVAYEDLQLLSRVYARNATLERKNDSWIVNSDAPVQLTAPGWWQAFRVDGHVWPGWGERDVILPAGTHQISGAKSGFRLVDTSVLDFRLIRFNGSLESLAPTDHGLQLTYSSASRGMALFNREPSEVRVDGRALSEEIPYSLGTWSVRLPSGHHTVDVRADNAATIILSTASLYSSSLIVIFGTVATGLMILLYMAILARRALRRAVQGRASNVANGRQN